MFTGIIEALGNITAVENRQGDLRLSVHSDTLVWSDVALGDSIATNGVCFTVVALGQNSFSADVSIETITLTTVGMWRVGSVVNLEKAMMLSSRMGGHMVSGHVDGIGEVLARHTDARSERFTLKAPANLVRYIAHKGSITIDGISLTVNAVDGETFELNIVPHTLNHTVIGQYRVGTKINIEVDIIARYLERLIQGGALDHSRSEAPSDKLNHTFLAENGYVG